MFSVIFEVNPKASEWNAYLANAKKLRPELEKIEGFVDNIRYASLNREGWILSLSGWRDEKALVRWRTKGDHHDVQQKGRDSILQDYHLRVGQITDDTRVPAGQELKEQRLDETEVGAATTISLIDGRRDPAWVKAVGAQGVAQYLGLDLKAKGLTGWDVFEAVLTPGDVILLTSWHQASDAAGFKTGLKLAEGARYRQVRVVRDYGMFDRREAPQYYAAAPGRVSQ
jgi:heme-degrading monooxygenase HmoA